MRVAGRFHLNRTAAVVFHNDASAGWMIVVHSRIAVVTRSILFTPADAPAHCLNLSLQKKMLIDVDNAENICNKTDQHDGD